MINANFNKFFLSYPDADGTIELVNGLGLMGNNSTVGRSTSPTERRDRRPDQRNHRQCDRGDRQLAQPGGERHDPADRGELVCGGHRDPRFTPGVSNVQSGNPASNIGVGHFTVKQGGTFRDTGTGAETFDCGLWTDNEQGELRHRRADGRADPRSPSRAAATRRWSRRAPERWSSPGEIGGGASIRGRGGHPRLSATSNDFSGDVTVTAGTLRLSADGVIAGSSLVQRSPGATIDVSSKAGGHELPAATQTIQGGGAVAGSIIVGGGSTLAPGEQPRYADGHGRHHLRRRRQLQLAGARCQRREAAG